ncbi:hypothetical protein [Euzebya sp.]|uniref:hypothetical protein n=1 Tax=Euzebya sp. TaxID=1971409 RepID=UPI0035156403
MTPAKVWTFLRWPIAILGLLAVVNYALPRLGEAASGMIEFDASGSILAPDEGASESEDPLDIPVADIPQSTLQAGTGPVTDGSSTPIADFTVNDSIADIDGESLEISDDPADAIVVAFDIPQGDPACMQAVTLSMTVDDLASPVQLGVFPSTVDQPVDVVDNQAMDPELRAGDEMAGTLVDDEGEVTFDLTAGFQEYFTLGFPSDKPFVLTLGPTAFVETQGGVSFVAANAEVEGEVPTLLWTGTPGCGGADALPTEGA